MSISSIFNVTKRALMAHQSAMNTTSSNIANVNTEGYKRRKVELTMLTSYGIRHDNITRLRQQFVERQLSYETQNLSKYEMDKTITTQIEDIFGEPNESGLNNVLSEFWNSWNNLANDPESQYARTNVRDKGVVLANTFNRINSDLNNLNQQIKSDIADEVNQVNQIINQMKSVNQQISAKSSDDLLDQRDLLVTKLSNLLNIDTRESASGEITISIDGQILVTSDYANELIVNNSTENGISITNVYFENGNHPVNIHSGEIGSLMEITNKDIPGYIDNLDTLARSIAGQVNAIHSKGYNLNGATGINFFSDDISGSGDFKVSEDVFNDPSIIATAETIDNPGDGSIAQSVFDLQFVKFVQDNTVFDFHNSTIARIGNKVQESDFLCKSGEMVVLNLKNQQDSVSGVSLDEEMTNLLKHKQAYEAATKMVSTVDSMMQTILDML